MRQSLLSTSYASNLTMPHCTVIIIHAQAVKGVVSHGSHFAHLFYRPRAQPSDSGEVLRYRRRGGL